MNLVMQTFGRCVKPLFGTGVGRIPLVVPFYKWIWKKYGQKGVVKTTANGFNILIDGKDWAIVPSLYFAHVWEKDETEVFNKFVKEGMTVIDIGAHVGYFSLLASKLVGSKGEVLSLEPTPETYKLLERNIYENGVRNITAYRYAISNKCGDSFIRLDGVSPASNTIYGNGRNTIEVKTKTLDSLVHKADFIKMDIEGGECQALDGMIDVIQQSPDLIMLTEVYPAGLERAGSSLTEYITKLEKYFDLFDMEWNLTNLPEVKARLKRVGSLNLICRRKNA